MKALVTGGAGFIGSALVERLLAEGHAVEVVDDLSTGTLANLAGARASGGHRLTFHQIDIRSTDLAALLERRRPEVVFHLAAQPGVRPSVTDPFSDAEINVLGSLRVIDAARRAGAAKVVFASSGGTIYGDAPRRDLPLREGRTQRPRSPYGVSKKAVTDYLQVYRELHDLEFTSLALANVYGPRQDPGGEAGVVAIFARELLAGRAPAIFGDGRQTRDFVFVDDVVDAFARAATKGSGLLLNVGTGVETSVNDLYGIMAAAAGVSTEARREPARAGELRRVALDASRARLHLGWEPWTALADGIAATLDWQRGGARRS